MDFTLGFPSKLALHEFVRRIESSLAKKKTALGIFLDIVGAFDNVTHKSIVRRCSSGIGGVAFTRQLDRELAETTYSSNRAKR